MLQEKIAKLGALVHELIVTATEFEKGLEAHAARAEKADERERELEALEKKLVARSDEVAALDKRIAELKTLEASIRSLAAKING